MEKANRKNLKRILLLSFVTVCVILIVFIWVDGITQQELVKPSYYRETFVIDESIYITETALAEEYKQQHEGTPMPTEEHRHKNRNNPGDH